MLTNYDKLFVQTGCSGGRSPYLVRSLLYFVRFKALLYVVWHNSSLVRSKSLKSSVLKAQLFIVEDSRTFVRANCPSAFGLFAFEVVAHLLVVVQLFLAKGQDTQIACERVVRTHEPIVNCSHSYSLLSFNILRNKIRS